MTRKKSSSRPNQYSSAFHGENARIIKYHGDEQLLNEVKLLRYMMLVVLQQMNAKKKKLTYYDYLNTLRVVSLSAGRVAHLVDIQYRIFSPRQQLEQAHQEEMEQAFTGIREFFAGILGQDAVAEIELNAMQQVLLGGDRKSGKG